MPDVSVVIPAFNSAQYVGSALKSVATQTLPGIEVVLVDDGSTDETLAVARTFEDALDLRILQQPNSGPAAARNAGILAAKGAFCAFLDADDLMMPTRLAEQTQVLRLSADMAMVHTDLMTFDEQGVVHSTRRAFSDPGGGGILDDLLLDNFITTSTVMARRERLIEVGLFREGRHISEDFELWLRVAERWVIGYIDQPLVMYRYSPGSLSGNKLVTALAALEVVQEFWDAHPEYRRLRGALYHRSIGRHLAAAGSAAERSNRVSDALKYLLAALRHDPMERRTWKELARALLRAAGLRRAWRFGASQNATRR